MHRSGESPLFQEKVQIATMAPTQRRICSVEPHSTPPVLTHCVLSDQEHMSPELELTRSAPYSVANQVRP